MAAFFLPRSFDEEHAERQTAGVPPRRCPCGTGLPHAECFVRLHQGTVAAATAEQLMRSRYSAFVLGDAAYLLATWHPDTRPRALQLDDDVSWIGLEILGRTRGTMLDRQGTVEFRARYVSAGRPGVQHENSRFVRTDATWHYLDGVSVA